MNKRIKKVIRYFEQGQLEVADKLLSEILLNDTSNFDALYIKGVISGIKCKYTESISYLLRAEEINPFHVLLQFNLAKVNSENGDEIKALEHYKNIIKISPKSFDAWIGLGVSQFNLKLFKDSLHSFEQVVEINNQFWGGYYNLGNAQSELNILDEALKNYNKAIELNPNIAEIYSNRGNVLIRLKCLEEALGSYNKAIKLNNNFTLAYFNRGNILNELNILDEALHNYNKAIQLNNNFPEAYSNRGNVLRQLKCLEEAQKSYETAIELNPQYAEAYYNLGNVFSEIKHLDKAVDNYGKAISLNHNYLLAYYARGNAYIEQNQVAAAYDNYLKATQIFPNYDYLFGTLLHTKMRICEWQNYEDDIKKLKKSIIEGDKICRGFHALGLIDSLPLQLKVAEIVSNDRYPPRNELGLISKNLRKQKIKIAYYSEDFREHAVSYLIAELFEYHNKNQFEVFGFYFGPSDESDMHKRISSSFDEFFEIGGYSDKEVAQLSRDLGINIAIDLNGFTGNERTGIFAYRAAPIQVNYLGYLGTLGTGYHDYIIADKTLIPLESRQYYTEKILYLPSYQPNDTKRLIPDEDYSKAELSLPAEGFVFCCLNNNYKITPEVFKVWMNILKSVTGSVLLLFAESTLAEVKLKREAEKLGVSINRLIFTKRAIRSKYLAKYKVADLFLDTLPYNGGTTVSDALWVGLPVLTCLGDSFASRIAASLLNAIELPELVTKTLEQYEAKAIELGSNNHKYRVIKDKLERSRLTTSLFDPQRYALHIEAGYKQMYERYQTDQLPDHIYISA